MGAGLVKRGWSSACSAPAGSALTIRPDTGGFKFCIRELLKTSKVKNAKNCMQNVECHLHLKLFRTQSLTFDFCSHVKYSGENKNRGEEELVKIVLLIVQELPV